MQQQSGELALGNRRRDVHEARVGGLQDEGRDLQGDLCARRIARQTNGIRLRDEDTVKDGVELLVISATIPALDEFVKRLVEEEIAVRELAPVVSPLEAAFLALTEQQENN